MIGIQLERVQSFENFLLREVYLHLLTILHYAQIGQRATKIKEPTKIVVNGELGEQQWII
jgi:hypothetical protein